MPELSNRLAIAFEGPRCIANGPLPAVALAIKKIRAGGASVTLRKLVDHARQNFEDALGAEAMPCPT